jgi:hypothetical protein
MAIARLLDFLGMTLTVFGIVGLCSGAMAQKPSSLASAPDSESTQMKIARALSAAPPDIARAATVVETNSLGKTKVLRAGTNGITCMPGDPGGLGPGAWGLGAQTMCQDQASMQWFSDFAQRKPRPTNRVPGITYMLAGGTQRSDTDPYDKTSPLIRIGPHWMIMWPLDPKAMGLADRHKASGAYIKWAGTPYAYLDVMGHP